MNRKIMIRGLAGVLLLLNVVVGVSCVWGMEKVEAQGLFRKAVIAYNDDAFDEAIALNTQILDGGFESEAVYYNLGNAWFKKGRVGQAILYYLRAEALAPRDADLRANLDFARRLVENYTPFEGRKKLGRFFPFQRFSGEELKWISFLLFAVTGILFLLVVYWGEKRKRLGLAASLCAIFFLYFLTTAVLKVVLWSGHGVCLAVTEAKFEPSEKGTTFFKLPEGTEIRILREKDGWFKIVRPDGKTGWIPVDKAAAI